MPDETTTLLLFTAVSTAVVHTLIPDHWLPFVLVGRARLWTARRTAFVSGLSAALHVALSVALAVGALLVGRETAHALGEDLEHASAVLLVTFGLAYAAWAWRKGGHFHPGGRLLHEPGEDGSCDGREGVVSDDHLHYHADEAWIRPDSGRGAVALALVVGLNPCILLLPIVLAAASRGRTALAVVVLAYAVVTTTLMVGLSVLGVAGSRRIPVPAAARHMEMGSGLLIAAVGVAFLVFGG